jgi:hypothetical protein
MKNPLTYQIIGKKPAENAPKLVKKNPPKHECARADK